MLTNSKVPMFYAYKYSLLILLIFIIISCSSDNLKNKTNNVGGKEVFNNTPLGQASVIDHVSAKNILQVAISSKDHSTLVAAVKAAQIEHVLVNTGPLTVFAPNNEAFNKLPPGTVVNLLKPENKEKLTDILVRHAAPGSYNLAALEKEAKKKRKLYMATGDYFEVEKKGSEVFVGGVKILTSIKTSNGIINVIDEILIPK